MAAVRQSGSQRNVGSLLSERCWCVERAVASSSKRRTSGQISSALAWVPGPGRSPARSSNSFGICVTRLPDLTYSESVNPIYPKCCAASFGSFQLNLCCGSSWRWVRMSRSSSSLTTTGKTRQHCMFFKPRTRTEEPGKKRRGRKNETRATAMYLCRTLGGHKLTDIGKVLGLETCSSMSLACLSMKGRIENEKRLACRTRNVGKLLKSQPQI